MTACLTGSLLAAAMLLQSTPDDPRRPVLEQCYREVRTACVLAPDGGRCLDRGRRVCDMAIGDPEEARSRGGANLRRSIPDI